MWLRDLKHKNKLSEHPRLEEPLFLDDVSVGEREFCLTKEEHGQLKEAEQALQRELALGVRHIDPAEYSDERIERLLEQASQNRSYRWKRRKH